MSYHLLSDVRINDVAGRTINIGTIAGNGTMDEVEPAVQGYVTVAARRGAVLSVSMAQLQGFIMMNGLNKDDARILITVITEAANAGT